MNTIKPETCGRIKQFVTIGRLGRAWQSRSNLDSRQT